jgi:hypothetical protein
MGELAAAYSLLPTVELPVLFVNGHWTIDLGAPVKRLQAVIVDRVGIAPNQISTSLMRPRLTRRVPLKDGTD